MARQTLEYVNKEHALGFCYAREVAFLPQQEFNLFVVLGISSLLASARKS